VARLFFVNVLLRTQGKNQRSTARAAGIAARAVEDVFGEHPA
jgi:hypothetical protein